MADDADCAVQTRYGLSANGKLVYSDKRSPEKGFVDIAGTGVAQPEEEWKLMADIVSPSFIFGVISARYSVLQFEEAIAAMAGQRAY